MEDVVGVPDRWNACRPLRRQVLLAHMEKVLLAWSTHQESRVPKPIRPPSIVAHVDVGKVRHEPVQNVVGRHEIIVVNIRVARFGNLKRVALAKKRSEVVVADKFHDLKMKGRMHGRKRMHGNASF